MNERGKSDNLVVPAKPPNNAGELVAEVVEGRRLAEGNTDSSTRPGRSAGHGVPSGLDRVREVARRDNDARFTALLHHVDLARLWAAYVAINPKAAPGADQVTWDAYGQDLRENLEDLLRRVHSGAYRASPSRRVYIPKPDGRQRPLGIATIADKRVLRLIRKWMTAGVIEDGNWSETVEGSPQGASVSPLLANVYLHYVFDVGADWWRRRYAHGDVNIVRFADDFVVGFQHLGDAKRFLSDLRKRFAKFSLELHPDKTRLIEFGRFAAKNRRGRGLAKPETFDFLGFTHVCGKTRDGRFWLRRITIKKRMRAKLNQVKAELRRRRHWPIPEQGRWLASVLRGHFNYYAVPGNIDLITAFRDQIRWHWIQTLRRRSQRHRMTWERYRRIEKKWLPPARIVHPYPSVRFAARTQGRSPVR